MTRPVDPAKLDHAFRAYRSGQSVSESAASAGIGITTLHRALTRAGEFENRRRLATPPGLAGDYLSGESVKALAGRHGASRRAIERMLSEAGIDIRGRGESMRIRWQHASPGERTAMLSAAHLAVLGRQQSPETRVRIAIAKNGRALSGNEPALGDLLASLGYDVAYGVPCGPYNLDIVAGGTVAVEVFGGNWHAQGRHRARFGQRARHVLDAGYSLAIVWADQSRHAVSVRCAQHVGTLVEITRGHPSIKRQHWVIRGDGHFLAAREDDGQEVPFVMPGGRCDG